MSVNAADFEESKLEIPDTHPHWVDSLRRSAVRSGYSSGGAAAIEWVTLSESLGSMSIMNKMSLIDWYVTGGHFAGRVGF